MHIICTRSGLTGGRGGEAGHRGLAAAGGGDGIALRAQGLELLPPDRYVRCVLLARQPGQLASVKIGFVRFDFARFELFRAR